MPIRRVALFVFAMGFVTLCATGCVMQRTVKQGDEVVAQGYVVRPPPVP